MAEYGGIVDLSAVVFQDQQLGVEYNVVGVVYQEQPVPAGGATFIPGWALNSNVIIGANP